MAGIEADGYRTESRITVSMFLGAISGKLSMVKGSSTSLMIYGETLEIGDSTT
jgi:hypothetical protein